MHLTSSQRSLQQVRYRSIASSCILFLGRSPAGSPRKFRDRKLHRRRSPLLRPTKGRFEMSVTVLDHAFSNFKLNQMPAGRTLAQQLRDRSIASSQASACVNGRPTGLRGTMPPTRLLYWLFGTFLLFTASNFSPSSFEPSSSNSSFLFLL